MAGMVMGIIGGVIALIVGAVGYAATSTLGSIATGVGDARSASSMQLYSIMSIVLPILGLVGAGIAKKNNVISAVMMGASAIGIILVFGFGFMSIVPAALLGVGAFLVGSDSSLSASGAR